MSTKPNTLPPHPGDALAERLQQLGISAYKLGVDVGTTPVWVYNLLSEAKLYGGRNRRSLTAQTALLLAKYLGEDAEAWLLLQIRHDLALALRDRHFVAKLAKVKPFSPSDASMLTSDAASPDRRRARAPRKATAKKTSARKTTAKTTAKKKATKSAAKPKHKD